MGYHGEKGGIPRVVKDSIQFLRDSGMFWFYIPPIRRFHNACPGLEGEGLFRRSPSSTMLRAAQDAYDRGMVTQSPTRPPNSSFTGNVVSLNNFGDPFLAAVLIKKYLRDLPEPIFPDRLYPIIRRCPPPTSDPSDMAALTYVRDILLPELVPCAYILLSNVLRKFHRAENDIATVSYQLEQTSCTKYPSALPSTKWTHIT